MIHLFDLIMGNNVQAIFVHGIGRSPLSGSEATAGFVRGDGGNRFAHRAGDDRDAMDGAPGVKSKRFAGADSPFAKKIARILAHLRENPTAPRTARFRCCVAIAQPGSEVEVFEAVKESVIAPEPRGERGFGYDPIFLFPEFGKTYAELESDQKNRISHRGIVLRQAAMWLAHHGSE
jgi:XTP/dITP diphosphohydrolase